MMKNRTFKEVEEFLKNEHQIDLDHDRFLILQGEVESISMMPAKGANPNETGLLEYLEDIIGSSKYTSIVDSIKTELESKMEEKFEKQNTVSGIKKNIKEMHNEKEEAFSFTKLETKAYKLMLLKDFASFGRVRRSMNGLEETKFKIEVRIEDLLKSYESKEGECKEKANILRQLKAETDKNNEEIKSLDIELKDLNKRDVEARNNLKRYILEVNEIEDNIKKNEKKIQSHEKELKVYEEKIPELKKNVDSRKKEMEEAKDVIDKIESEIQEEVEGSRKEINSLESRKQIITLKITKEQNEIKKYTDLSNNEYDREKRVVDEAKESLIKEKENLSRLEDDYENICIKFENKIGKEVSDCKQQIKVLEEERSQLKQEESELINEIEETKESSGFVDGIYKILDKLFKAQEDGKLTGIKGRLGDLGTIESKYDIAISTSCPKLNLILVNTVDEANKVLDYCREYRVGGVQCLALDQATKNSYEMMMKPFEVPVNSKRLFDLIKPNSEELKVAFFSVINNTLVVNDVEAASKLAYGDKRYRYRVVTIDGNLFEVTGVSSGGGKPRKGLMSSVKARKSLSKEHVDIHKIIEKKEKISQNIRILDATINELNDKIKTLLSGENNREAEAFKEKYPITKKGLTHKIFKLEEEYEFCNKKYQSCLDQKAEYQAHLKELIDNKDQELYKELENIEKNIANLQSEIDKAGGKEYKAAKSKFESIKEEYDQFFDIYGKAVSQKELGEKEVEKFKQEIADCELKRK